MTLLELYKKAYPESEIWDYHLFTTCFHLGICINEHDKQLYEKDYELAKSILEKVIKDKE